MTPPTPEFLLDNPDLVLPVAPWCSRLSNLELGILLLTQPWLAEGGLQRADLERRLSKLGDDMPVGQVYFQRVNRSTALLEKRGQLVGSGDGRQRRFALSPEGFGALILNLQVMHDDPTVDGSEFELKRSLVAMGNVAVERLLEMPSEVDLGGELTGWFEAVDRLEVWGQRILTDRVHATAFDILHLLELQRGRVRGLLESARRRVEEMQMHARLLRSADLSGLKPGSSQIGPSRDAGRDHIVRMARTLAAGGMPELAARARQVRYEAFLRYLDDLDALYSKELGVVDVAAFRRAMTGSTMTGRAG